MRQRCLVASFVVTVWMIRNANAKLYARCRFRSDAKSVFFFA